MRAKYRSGTVLKVAAGPLALAVALVAGAAGMRAAEEAPPPSAENGYTLADKFCKGCHVIESGASTVVPAGPPTFNTIATRKDQTVERIRNVLINPHPPMPDMSLSNAEILDLVAYIDKLRTGAGQPSLLPPPDQKKPKHPSPS